MQMAHEGAPEEPTIRKTAGRVPQREGETFKQTHEHDADSAAKRAWESSP
jgi:hypothetical protein